MENGEDVFLTQTTFRENGSDTDMYTDSIIDDFINNERKILDFTYYIG
jgi:hypothetical protein